MKKRIFTSIAMLSGISALLVSVALSFVFYGRLSDYARADLKKYAQAFGVSASHEAAIADLTEFRDSDTRYTVIAPDGAVLYDSSVPADTLPSHLERGEVADALAGGTGEARRMSETLRQETYYYAVRMPDGYVLRASKTQDSIYALFSGVLPISVFIAFAICALGYIAAGRVAGDIIKPLSAGGASLYATYSSLLRAKTPAAGDVPRAGPARGRGRGRAAGAPGAANAAGGANALNASDILNEPDTLNALDASDADSLQADLLRADSMWMLTSPYDELSPYIRTITRQRELIAGQLAELRNRTDTINTIMDNMREGLILVNSGGVIVSANKSVLRILGAEAPMGGQNILDLLRDVELIRHMRGALAGMHGEMDLARSGVTYRVYFSPANSGGADAPESGHGASAEPAMGASANAAAGAPSAAFSGAAPKAAANASAGAGAANPASADISAAAPSSAAHTPSAPAAAPNAAAPSAGATSAPTREAAGSGGAIIMFMDITEKAHAEKIRREFSANVSHELKTPLTSISGYAEMLCGGFCSNEEDKLAFAGKIRDEAARLMSLINDVLLISELDEARNAENGMPPGGAPAGPAARGGGLGGIGAAGHGAFEDVDIAGVALEVVQSLAARARHCDVHVGIRRFGAAIASEAGLAADSAPPAAPNAARPAPPAAPNAARPAPNAARPAASGATWRVAAEDVSASAAAAAANATNAADFANAAADSANAAAYAAAAADVPAGAADSAAGSVIRANRVMAFEMLYNLVDNAIKYNKPGGSVMVDIRRAGGRLSVAVSDTGIGIPKEAQGRVFERFFRVDKSRSRKTGGTGLGLAIVKHVAQTHDAAIALESRLGEGTSVTLEFAPQKL